MSDNGNISLTIYSYKNNWEKYESVYYVRRGRDKTETTNFQAP